MFAVRSIARHAVAAAACAAAAIAAAPAHAVDLQVGSYAKSGIGEEFVSGYDTVSFVGDTIDLSPSSVAVSLSLGTLSFEVGPNCYSCSLRPSFDALIDVSLGGVTQQIDLPYAWYSSGPSDFLTFSRPAPVVFDLASLGLLTITFDVPATLTSAGGIVHGSLDAHVQATAVPEPGTYALLMTGLVMIGFVAGRRRA